MYTLDNKKYRIIYLALAAFCGIASTIYECFSHGVISPFMIAPGIIVFVIGFILMPILSKHFTKISFNLYNSFLAVTVVGSYFKGVLDIYGTTNDLIYVYLIAGIIFFILTIIFYIKGVLDERKRISKSRAKVSNNKKTKRSTTKRNK